MPDAQDLETRVALLETRLRITEDIAAILEPVARPLAIDAARKPHVVLVVGVNGTGKTTTASVILQFCEQRVLVTAPSNGAVRELLDRFLRLDASNIQRVAWKVRH